MFSKATANFVRQVDPEGSLKHVSRINDAHKLVPMALMVKRNRFWFWQRTKYHPTDFLLKDVLQGDEDLTARVHQGDFLTYEGTFGDKLKGTLEAEVASVGLGLQGQGTSELQANFGKLKKEELDVKKLLEDSSNRLVDMQHMLVQQLEKRAEVLAVVKQTIFTTEACAVKQIKKESCALRGIVGLMGTLGGSVKLCVKDINEIEVDSDVVLEIPSATVIAYSVLELDIKKDGTFEICLQPGKIGGFEADMVKPWSSTDSLEVDGRCAGQDMPEEAVQLNGSDVEDLSALAELPQSARRALFSKLQDILRDGAALSSLQLVLEEVCFGDQADTMQLEERCHGQTILLSDILNLLGHSAALLNAAHLLVSALEELPDESRSLMVDSQHGFFESFCSLVSMLRQSSLPLPIQSLPSALQKKQTLQHAERLLSSTGVTLRKDGDFLCVETGDKTEVDLLVLSLSAHGLALLCGEQK
ncbi:gasdermin-E-like [Nerophis ophidion]|uniref:gasdermin-E-like n=1 Tax=Nerophis ophidion TaxID=159077 RepID=UPI002AE07C5B|nr:gasdermin-E-like [Nerophis ophidion]